MKFKWKIICICLGVYIFTLVLTAFLVTKDTYNSTVNREIERTLEEQKNIYNSISLYLIVNEKMQPEDLNINEYSKRIIEMFGNDKDYIQLIDKEGKLLASNTSMNLQFSKKEIGDLDGNKRNYILRENNNEHYLFVNQLFKINKEEIVLSYIKKITHIDIQKKEQYMFFVKTGVIGLIFIAILSRIISNLLIKPIENLSKTSKHIATGNYENRAEVISKDEIGTLAIQFNLMAEEIEKKMHELEEEGQRKQRFIDNLTHELRTPLTSIIGYSDILSTIKYEEKNFNKGLGYINSEGKRMLNLITTLKDMILFRENTLPLEKASIKPLLEEVINIMAIKAKEKNIALELTGEDLQFYFHRDMLKGVIINLVDNSLLATSGGSKIILGIEELENTVCIYIKDFGRGMIEEDVKKVLEPFYRVDKSRSRKDGGVGLGLSICDEIIKRHNGRLEINSKLGEGTTVKIHCEKEGTGN